MGITDRFRKKKEELPERKPIRGIERCVKKCGKFTKYEDRMCDECFKEYLGTN